MHASKAIRAAQRIGGIPGVQSLSRPVCALDLLLTQVRVSVGVYMSTAVYHLCSLSSIHQQQALGAGSCVFYSMLSVAGSTQSQRQMQSIHDLCFTARYEK